MATNYTGVDYMNNVSINVSKSKVCKRCNERKPLTNDYFYVVKRNKDGFHGTCKVCRIKQAKKKDLARRKENGHLIHNLVCKYCNGDFMADKKSRIYCSVSCSVHHRNQDEGFVSKMKRVQEETLKQREVDFKNKFNERFGANFIYVSGYKHSDKSFKCKCLNCDKSQSRTARIVRGSKHIRCDHCGSTSNEELKQAQREQEERNQVKEMIKENNAKMDSFINSIRDKVSKEYNYVLGVCDNCDNIYESKRKGTKFCSDRCSSRHNERIRDKRVRRQTVECDNRGVITLEKLIKRDNNVCHICDEMCDINDHELTDEGYFIVGHNYPSIDHVKPLSKGGIHSWDNVRLSHHYCNTLKNDKLILKPKQLTLL